MNKLLKNKKSLKQEHNSYLDKTRNVRYKNLCTRMETDIFQQSFGSLGKFYGFYRYKLQMYNMYAYVNIYLKH